MGCTASIPKGKDDDPPPKLDGRINAYYQCGVSKVEEDGVLMKEPPEWKRQIRRRTSAARASLSLTCGCVVFRPENPVWAPNPSKIHKSRIEVWLEDLPDPVDLASPRQSEPLDLSRLDSGALSDPFEERTEVYLTAQILMKHQRMLRKGVSTGCESAVSDNDNQGMNGLPPDDPASPTPNYSIAKAAASPRPLDSSSSDGSACT
eukprot:Sspe_Gene.86347::Locus_57029_Transcript_1_1_Confidence_1.000_Length_849::g.86347::m.86347